MDTEVIRALRVLERAGTNLVKSLTEEELFQLFYAAKEEYVEKLLSKPCWVKFESWEARHAYCYVTGYEKRPGRAPLITTLCEGALPLSTAELPISAERHLGDYFGLLDACPECLHKSTTLENNEARRPFTSSIQPPIT